MVRDIEPWAVFVDKREPRDILELCDCLSPIEYKVVNLLCGDFALYYNNIPVVGIERKEIKDLLLSIKDKRIFLQSDMMKGSYDINYIAISGSLGDEIYDSNLSTSVVMGTISSLIVRRGMNIIWFERDDHLVECVFGIFEKIIDGKYDDIETSRSFGSRFKSFPYYTLIKIPFINNKIAEELLERFGTIEQIKEASKDELMEIKGLGPVKSEKLIGLLKKA